MRIISQDKRIDIPYNMVYIKKSCIENKILAYNDAILGDGHITLGTYGSKKRAYEVLNEMRIAFTKPNSDKSYFEMPEK